jgi:hypothetical protein
MKTYWRGRSRGTQGVYASPRARRMVLLLAGILCLHLTALEALSVTQEFLERECRKTDIRVVGSDPAMGTRPGKVIITYNCAEIGQAVEYEALHFLCSYHGPKLIAAAIYDVQGQTYLRDPDESGNFRSVVKVDDIPTPSCDLPL